MTQGELARRAGVSQPVISAYENGRREPGLSMLTKLVNASGCGLDVRLVSRRNDRADLPDTPMGNRLRRDRHAVIDVLAESGMSGVRVFGSVGRGDDSDESDVDLLVDVPEEVSLLDLIRAERKIASIIGRDVDLVPTRGLKGSMSEKILAEAIPL